MYGSNVNDASLFKMAVGGATTTAGGIEKDTDNLLLNDGIKFRRADRSEVDDSMRSIGNKVISSSSSSLEASDCCCCCSHPPVPVPVTSTLALALAQ